MSYREYDFDKLFSILNHSTIGADRFAPLFERASVRTPNFPPYNINQHENTYTISVALAGYSPQDVTVSVRNDILKISSDGGNSEDETLVHKGIAKRSFKLNFDLFENLEVKDAQMENGMLFVTIERIIPPEEQERKIEIKTPTMLEHKT